MRHPTPPSFGRLAACVVLVTASGAALAQDKPVNGIRPADLRAHALVGVRAVMAPGQVMENATRPV